MGRSAGDAILIIAFLIIPILMLFSATKSINPKSNHIYIVDNNNRKIERPETPVIKENEPAPVWAWAYVDQPPSDRVLKAFTLFPNPPACVRKGPEPNKPDDPRYVDGSKQVYSRLEICNHNNVIDWFPEDHPQMPDIIRHGPKSLREGKGWACASCHLPNGRGRPENAPLAGLPEDYFVQQLIDMKNGTRQTSDPRKSNAATMNELASKMSEEEMWEAAAYFATTPYVSQIKVIETDETPPLDLHKGGMYILAETGENMLLGNKIAEAPIDQWQASFLRNPRSGWVAYVPVGSIDRGKNLVLTGGNSGMSCNSCHGENLEGVGINPGLAGRSPSYLMRQLYDFRTGSRSGAEAETMQDITREFTIDELRDIVAYLASTGSKQPQYVTEKQK